MQNRRGRLLARRKSGYYFFSVGRCGFIRFFQKFYLYRLILLLKAIFYDRIFKLKVLSFRCGLMVKRLRRSPLKAESGVRFSVGLPKKHSQSGSVFVLAARCYPHPYFFISIILSVESAQQPRCVAVSFLKLPKKHSRQGVFFFYSDVWLYISIILLEESAQQHRCEAVSFF